MTKIIAAVGVALVGGMLWANAALAGISKATFCKSRLYRDYESPLESLPAVAEIPRSGILSFAPAGIRLGRISLRQNRPRIIVGSGSFGYEMGSSVSTMANWNVISKLSRISSTGLTTSTVAEVSGFVGQVTNRAILDFVLKTPGKPGMYRYDISFSDQAGKPLGAFASYFRVVPANLNVLLSIQKRNLHPGEIVNFRVQNRGTEELEYTTLFRIQRRVKSDWVTTSLNGYRLPFPPTRLLSAGEVGQCESVRLPKNLPAGRYRIARSMERAYSSDRNSTFLRTVDFVVR